MPKRSLLLSALMIASLWAMSAKPSKAEDTVLSPSDAMGLVSFATLEVKDFVTGNCLTNLNAIKGKVKLLLAQNAIAVLEGDQTYASLKSPSISIRGVGDRHAGGRCVVTLFLTVSAPAYETYYSTDSEDRYFVPLNALVFEEGYVATNSNNVNQQATEFFEGSAANFVASVLSARSKNSVQEIQQDVPWLTEEPDLIQ